MKQIDEFKEQISVCKELISGCKAQIKEIQKCKVLNPKDKPRLIFNIQNTIDASYGLISEYKFLIGLETRLAKKSLSVA